MYVKILPLIICLMAILSCNKPDIKQYSPSAISGTWVISAENNQQGWIDKKATQVFDFDGKGGYTIRTCSGEAPLFYSGRIYAEETEFVSKDSKVYTVKNAEKEYLFESIPGSFTLVSSESAVMTFDYEGTSAAIKGYRLSKVLLFQSTHSGQDQESVINGTTIASSNDLVGLITDSKTRKGIPGVVVSDGYNCVKTDQNGVYQLRSNALSRMIYYSTPSEYKIATGGDKSSIPVYYKSIEPKGERIRTDFTLVPLDEGKESTWTFIGIGDPQCASASNVNRYSSETIPDITQAVANKKNVYAMTLGDIVFDSTNMWPRMQASMASVSTGSWYIPFFQTIGNHDHDSLMPDTSDDVKDDYEATSTFEKYYGPVNYSFNRGDVHIVSMDDIIVTSQKSSGKSNGKTWTYSGGFTSSQIEWLQKDLDLVDNKEQKMIFICCHIPFRNSSSNNYQKVLKLMEEFQEAHLMIGHTHYTQNYIYNNTHTAKGGLPIYEHIHGSACGAWWTKSCSSTVSGEPSGYTVYTIEGAHIKDWCFKGTRKEADFQLRVFDGNEIYYQSQYPLNWYTASQSVGSYTFVVKGNKALKDCFVAQVFNDDDTYWSVELRKKSTGMKIGNFTRLANGSCSNIAMSSHYYNKKSKTTDSYRSWTASHYWYYKPSSGNPASETDWEVVATQRIPGVGNVTHTYSCSKLTTESDFEKEFYF